MLLIPSLSNISESILHLSHALVAQPNISLPCRSSDPLPPSPRPDFLVLLIVCPCVKCDCVWHCKCVHACICMWRLCEGGYTSMCVCVHICTRVMTVCTSVIVQKVDIAQRNSWSLAIMHAADVGRDSPGSPLTSTPYINK